MSEPKESSAPEAPGPDPAVDSPAEPLLGEQAPVDTADASVAQPAVAARVDVPAEPTHVEAAPKSTPRDPSVSESSSDRRPTFVFFGVIAAISLLLDVASKAWAEVYFNRNLIGHSVSLLDDHLALVLAYNKGGAWGLGHGWSDTLRLPFFLLVSVAAIAFIVSLYSRLMPNQHALKWGLPLVLGGALGNLTDRIVRNQVIDFIDYRADWVRSMNEGLAHLMTNWSITDHWPTFNVADVAICAGVGLMAVDMLMSRRGNQEVLAARQPGATPPVEASEKDDTSAGSPSAGVQPPPAVTSDADSENGAPGTAAAPTGVTDDAAEARAGEAVGEATSRG